MPLIEVEDHVRTIKGIVRNYVELQRDEAADKPPFSVLLVWFSRQSEFWKAQAVTTIDQSVIYEVSNDGDDTFLDVYKKVHAIKIGPNGNS